MHRHREISSLRRLQIARTPTGVARVCIALTVAAMVSGCAWFSPDAGMAVVANIADRELNKDVAAIRTPDVAEAMRIAVQRLLGRALTADTAVQIALLKEPLINLRIMAHCALDSRATVWMGS